MKYKLIAIDMDGTLLNSENKISQRTKNAIKNAQEMGVHIVIATGRILKSALYYADKLNLKTPLVACNGAVVVDKSRSVISEKALSKDKIRNMIKLAKREEVYFHFYDKNSFYSDIRSEEVLEFYSEGNEETQIDLVVFKDIEDIIENHDLSVYKFLFVDNKDEKLKGLREKIDKVENISISSSWINNIEVMEEGVSKGRAVEDLCKKLNISPEEVIAIGDNGNDLSMIRFAGLGVAMENGIKRIKEESDYITSSNDNDGVAKVIEKFIL